MSQELQKENTQLIADFFSAVPEFKAWIENTSLFHALVNDVGGVIRGHGEDGSVVFEMSRGFHIIHKAEDLPIEMIMNFYENSPFYKQSSQDQTKQLTNGDKD